MEQRAMIEYLSVQKLTELGNFLATWFTTNVLVLSNAVQLAIAALTLALALLASRRLSPWLTSYSRYRPIVASLPLVLPLIWLVMQWLTILTASTLAWPHQLLSIVVSLLTAWVVIRFVSQLAKDPVWATVMAWTAWSIAALNILNLLDPMIAILDSAALTIGQVRISVYTVAKSTLALAALLWIALYVTSLLEARIRTSRTLSPSIQVLFTKSLKTVLITLAILIAIRSVGIDLTALAVVGGAIGLGVGFGLQKVISNLISGVILLVDKSIKPGDVIAVAGTYGWVTALGGRYVSVVTRDGIEHLIPNETLISERVENWTHSDNQTRLKIPVGVHYDADVRKAIDLCVAAAKETPRVLKQPEPRCLLMGFGDSAVDLELRMWIADAYNGVQNVKSEVLLGIWDKFHQEGIEIPYPQRDLHLRSAQGLNVSIDRPPA
jgi:small-conductance mechanosensitive channel